MLDGETFSTALYILSAMSSSALVFLYWAVWCLVVSTPALLLFFRMFHIVVLTRPNVCAMAQIDFFSSLLQNGSLFTCTKQWQTSMYWIPNNLMIMNKKPQKLQLLKDVELTVVLTFKSIFSLFLCTLYSLYTVYILYHYIGGINTSFVTLIGCWIAFVMWYLNPF